MENQPIFKTSLFGGFERQSVLNYIFELNNNAKAAQDRLNSQFEEVGAARERLSEAIKSLEHKLASSEKTRKELEDELENERGRFGKMNAMLDSLNSEIERQKAIISSKDAEIRGFGKIKEDLERKNAELESKRADVEKVSVYLGDLVVRTRMEAEKVLDDANTQAKNVVDEAVRSLGSVFDQFNQFRAEMESIEEKIEEAVIEMQSKFAAIGQTISESEENIRGFYRPYNLTLVKDELLETDTPPEVSFFRSAAD